MDNKEYLNKAIKLSEENVENSIGGPFGAVIVKDGEIIATGTNEVTSSNDPTAHAEIIAIRRASAKLNTFDLSECILYTSCEPCPMCMSAVYWARIGKVYYANKSEEAAAAGFDDQWIYEELEKEHGERLVLMQHIHLDNAGHAFQMWNKSENKIEY